MSKRQESFTLAAGETRILAPVGAPWSLAVDADSGGEVLLMLTVTPAHAIGADGSGALWHQLGEMITGQELIAYPAPVTGLLVQAVGAGATVELAS